MCTHACVCFLKECTLCYTPVSVCVLTRGCVCFEGVCSLQLYVCVCARTRVCMCAGTAEQLLDWGEGH